MARRLIKQPETPSPPSSGPAPSSAPSSKVDSEISAVLARLEQRLQDLENRPSPDQEKIAALEAQIQELKTPSAAPMPASSDPPASGKRPISNYGWFHARD